MEVLVTGVKGQLGHGVVDGLEKRGHVAAGVGIEEMDTADATSVERVITEADVGAVVHCTTYTAADVAEDNVDMCQKVNADDTKNVARTCEKLNIKMMYVSTNYILDDQGARAQKPDDGWEPLNTYGLTRCEGELTVERHLSEHFVVRIVWVFSVNGKNFTKTILNLDRIHGSIVVMDDQASPSTYTYDLARFLADMVETERYNRYYATNEGLYGWYESACEMLKRAGMEVAVPPMDSVSCPSRVRQPMDSHANKDRLEENGLERLPFWQDALSRYLQEIEY